MRGFLRCIPLLALAAGMAASAQTPPLWATVPDVPPLPKADLSGYVSSDGAQIYYAVFNPKGGSPVILLHGGFASSASWGDEVPRLVHDHEVIVMDNRGHGRSSMPVAPLSYAQMASDAVAVLDAVHVRQASVVGLSDGAIMGLVLGFRYPDRVDKLFLWGASFNTHADRSGPPDPAMKGMGAIFMARMQSQYEAVSPTKDGFSALRAKLGQLYSREPNLTPAELGRIKAPTVIADGQHEQFISAEHTRQLAQLIPHARLVILANVSHGGPQQDPAAFHRAVETFLREPDTLRTPNGWRIKDIVYHTMNDEHLARMLSRPFPAPDGDPCEEIGPSEPKADPHLDRHIATSQNLPARRSG